MKTIASIALVALLAGCSGGASSVPSSSVTTTTSAGERAPQSGGPGTTTITYYDTYAPTNQCHPGGLTITVGGSYPTTHLNFAAGDGPQLIVANCHFQTPQYVRVTLGRPQYGTPFIRQTAYAITVDAPAAAQVTATWTALGPTLPGDEGLKGTVSFTIGPPGGGGGL